LIIKPQRLPKKIVEVNTWLLSLQMTWDIKPLCDVAKQNEVIERQTRAFGPVALHHCAAFFPLLKILHFQGFVYRTKIRVVQT